MNPHYLYFAVLLVVAVFTSFNISDAPVRTEETGFIFVFESDESLSADTIPNPVDLSGTRAKCQEGWYLTRWTGSEWSTSVITETTHSYDM